MRPRGTRSFVTIAVNTIPFRFSQRSGGPFYAKIVSRRAAPGREPLDQVAAGPPGEDNSERYPRQPASFFVLLLRITDGKSHWRLQTLPNIHSDPQNRRLSAARIAGAGSRFALIAAGTAALQWLTCVLMRGRLFVRKVSSFKLQISLRPCIPVKS